MKNIENLHDDVFGKTFAMYDKEEMIRFIEPLEIRFEKNHLNPSQLFKGKRCLDAGCGNGRGSIFMSMHGAREVHALDVSQTNIESTKKNASLFGFSDVISTSLSSLETIPFADEFFDFVWCNGVLMHTHNPDKCLKELTRVLKNGGSSWVYVYGSGGVYWYCVYKFREMLKNFSEAECIQAMQFIQVPVQFLAEYMDDWKAPYLRTYTNKDFSKRLSELGFKNTNPLPYGVPYDTSQRINTFKDDALFLGEGDLRYLLKKEAYNIQEDEHPISSSIVGSDYEYSEMYTNVIDDRFSKIGIETQNSLIRKILVCAYIQRHLRDDIFSPEKEFKLDHFVFYLDNAIKFLNLV